MRTLIRAAATALIVVSLVRCGADAEATAPAGSARVARGVFTEKLILTGELDAARADLITVPRLPQWQTSIKWLATDGTEVKAGERVVELDNSSFAASLDQKRRSEDEAQQALEQKAAEWQAELSRKELEVEKKRVEWEKAKLDAAVPQDLLSKSDYEENQLKLRRAEVELAKATTLLSSTRTSQNAERSNLELTLGRARREIMIAEQANSSLILQAPRDGILVVKDHPWEGRKLQTGDTVWVAMPLAGIPEPSSLQVTAQMADVDDGKVRIGMPAVVTLDAYPDRVFGGTVSDVAPVAQETNRASLRRFYRVIITLSNADPELMRPGFSVRAEIERRRVDNAILVPRGAIDYSGRTPRLRLASGVLRDLTLDGCNAQFCVATAGAREGEALTTSSTEVTR